MIATLIVAALATLAPGMNLTNGGDDSPIEPITTDDIQRTFDTVDMSEMCDGYFAVRRGIMAADPTMPDLMAEAADEIMIWSFERGWDPNENARMTSEARDLYLDWFQDC